MKHKRILIQIWLLCAVMLPAVVQAQFIFTTNNSNITIIGYTGPGGAVTIPSTTNGLPVTSIGFEAFSATSVTSITIPASITNIVEDAFGDCANLTGITVNALNSFYSSVAGVLFEHKQDHTYSIPRSQSRKLHCSRHRQ